MPVPLGNARVLSGPASDIVVIKDVHKSFGHTEVLKGIDMVCRRGETTCVVGGSGAGKTTLLRLVVGLDKPTSGSIYIDGEDIVPMGEHDLNRVRKKCGMVYQYAALLDSITGRTQDCLGNLARAIKLNPRNRLQARADNDFQSMVDDPRFTELLYPEIP